MIPEIVARVRARDSAAGDARAKWRMVWSLARYEARQGRPPVAIDDAWLTAARDALDARRDGVDASWPGARGRLLAGGWRPLPPPVLP